MRPDLTCAGASVELVDQLDAFTRLRADWNELLTASDADGPFLTWEWLHAWWSHLGRGRTLRIVAVRAGGQLIGLAPLWTSRPAVPWKSGLEFLGTGWAGSDYLDVVVRRSAEGTCVEALADWFQARKMALHLDHLSALGAQAARLANHLIDRGWAIVGSSAGACPFAILTGHSWTTYLQTLDRSHQTRFRRYLNTLNRKFELRFDSATTEARREEILQALMRFHNQRWGRRGGSTAFRSPALRVFHDEVTRRALDRGWLRLFLLRLNDQPAAAAYCFAYNGLFFLYHNGFNAQYRQYSAGLVMLGLTIRAAIEEGAREFDLLWGVEPYKWLWAQNARLLTRIDLFPPHPAGRLQHRTFEADRTMRRLARRIFPRKSCPSIRAGAGC